MRARRQLWWLISPFLVPVSFGALAWVAGRRALAALQFFASLTCLFAAGFIGSGGRWAVVATDPTALTLLLVGAALVSAVLVVASACQCVDAGSDGAGLAGRAAGWGAGLLASLSVAGLCAAAFWVVVPQISVARETFVDAPAADPHLLTTAPTTTSSGPSTTTAASTSTTTPDRRPDRFNLLLLGGDAAPGRYGLRTDSVNLVSIDPDGGQAAIIGIPRNLQQAPLPPGPLTEVFPDGFTDLFNALYGWGERNPDLVEEALGPTDAPGASLVAASAAEFLGVRVDAWILVDMAGFIDVVDAFGGVDVYVPKTVPAAGPTSGGTHELPDEFVAGWQRMDGTNALSYARSRKADSDYRRMERQRCLLASLAAQNDQLAIARVWPDLSKVVSDRVRTNLSPAQLRLLTRLVGLDVGSAASVGLVPPQVPPRGWDPLLVRRMVADALGLELLDVPGLLIPTGPGRLVASAPSTTLDAAASPSGSPATALPAGDPLPGSVDAVCRTVRPSS